MNNKIICFTDSLGLGGAQRQLVGLSLLLAKKGYDVKVLLYHDIPFYKHILDDSSIESVVIQGSGTIVSRILLLLKYLRKTDPDVIIAYQSSPSLIACLLRPYLHCKKLIVSERNSLQKLSLKVRVLSLLWRFADYIVPNSNSTTNFIKKNIPKYSDKLVTITNFIDTNLFVPAVKAHYRDTGVLKIVSLGRITSEKNILEYIKAVDIVRRRGLSIEVTWYGDTDNAEYDNECRGLIEDRNLKDVFKFHPAQKNVLDLYQGADVFCLPSLFEGFPNVVCEAMSCGVPILCSNICDNPMIVEDGGNGILFSPESAEYIAEAIVKYINQPQEKKIQMGARSRELAVEKFSSNVFIKKYIDLIER